MNLPERTVMMPAYETYEIPVTEHLHNYRGGGRVRKDEFVEVKGKLEEFNLNEEDKKRAMCQTDEESFLQFEFTHLDCEK